MPTESRRLQSIAYYILRLFGPKYLIYNIGTQFKIELCLVHLEPNLTFESIFVKSAP